MVHPDVKYIIIIITEERIKLFSAFFGIFKIKETGYISLISLYFLKKALRLYVPVLISLIISLLKIGTGLSNNAVIIIS